MSAALTGQKVLVLASDPLLGALIGALIEQAKLKVEFPGPSERPEEALARVRPLAAILVDALADEAESDLFLARARKGGIALLMFGSAEQIRRRSAWARESKVATFVLPAQLDALSNALEGLREPAKSAPRKGSRRTASVERNAEGVLVFSDSGGTRWSIYDRRLDRRRNFLDRRFVSEGGEVRHCDVSFEESQSEVVTTIEQQLARAVTE